MAKKKATRKKKTAKKKASRSKAKPRAKTKKTPRRISSSKKLNAKEIAPLDPIQRKARLAIRAKTKKTEPESNVVSLGLEDVESIPSSSDPLRRYMEEVKRHPLLAPEEEVNLAIKMHETGDLEAAKRLVSANLRLVVKIAFEYRSMYANVLDLIQEGNIGLMKAVSKFDPTKGARLGYYATWWIRSYILKYLLDNFRLVKIGTTQAQKKLFYHLMKEKERLEAQGILAGPKLLAEKLDVKESEVVEMSQRLSSQGAEKPLDAPVGDGTTTYLDLMEAQSEEGEDAGDRLAREQLLKLLKGQIPEFQETLNDKERVVLKERMLADEPKTLQELADRYGLTRERVRQIEVKVLSKLRAFLGPSFN